MPLKPALSGQNWDYDRDTRHRHRSAGWPAGTEEGPDPGLDPGARAATVREQGYQATTVEQIAAAAEVSPSTFFRYFPTKEDVVLQDDMGTMMLEAFEQAAPLRPLPDGVTDLNQFRVQRRDRAGGVIHEYRLVA